MASIIVPLLTGFDNKGIKSAERALDALGSKLKTFAKSAALTAGSYVVGRGAVQFVENSVTAAAELQQAMSGVRTIFGQLTPEIQKFIDNGNSMGMSMAEAAKATTFLGSVFKQTGMPMQDVIDRTETMVSLAADLAATYGYSVQEALTAMTATFRGEYDPIEKFGVAMKQQQVNAVLAERGLKGLTGAALIAAQQQIRYEMILERTTDAQGAFSRQSGNLTTQLVMLKAQWTDMQAVLGTRLIPVVVAFIEKIRPFVDQLAPTLARVFDAIGNTMLNLIPLFPSLGNTVIAIFEVLASAINTFQPVLTAVLDIIANNLPVILSFMAAFKISSVVMRNWSKIKYEIQFLTLALKEAAGAQALFNLAANANPYILAATAIAGGVALVVAGYQALAEQQQKVDDIRKTVPVEVLKEADAAAKAAAESVGKLGTGYADAALAAKIAWQGVIDKFNETQATIDRYVSAWASRYPSGAMYEALFGKKKVDTTTTTTETKQKIKTWFETLAEEIKKQAGRTKLTNLGLSQALVDSVINAQDWAKALAKISKMTREQLAKLQADFNKTAAGLSELDKAAADLAERQRAYQDAVQKRLDTIKSLTSGLGAFIPKTLAEITADVGQFEQDVISAAENLKGSLASALDNGDITKSAYDNLLKYAEGEIAALQKIARERDKLVAKIEAAKQVYLEVAGAVRNYGNITQTTTKSVTESYKKVIDGVEVTISRTVEALQSKDLVSNYKAIVDKTKTFLTQLQKLKTMGLNSTLFKQIIDAGVDAGGATADAIVAGGQETVNSLNDMFKQLDTAGAAMGDLTAQVMQDSGIKITSAFIDGLMAEEAKLANQAKTMAEIFSKTFADNVRLEIPEINPGDFGLKPEIPPVTKPDLPFSVWDTLTPEEQAKWNPVVNTSALNTPVNNNAGSQTVLTKSPTYNVTVNAGLGTDGTQLGLTLVQVLKQFERNNGAVWSPAT